MSSEELTSLPFTRPAEAQPAPASALDAAPASTPVGPTVEDDDPDKPRPRSGKLYYTIGEVALMLHVKPSLIRFWEQEFPHLRPKTNKKGDRRYKQADIAALRQVYTLVREKGYTLEGAREYIKEKRDDNKANIVQNLQSLKRFLQDLKQMLEPDKETTQA